MKNRYRHVWLLPIIGILTTQILLAQESTVVSRITKTEKGKAYLEVDGKPLLYNAVQAWKSPSKEYLNDNYQETMNKAYNVGYRIFSFWLSWRDLEPKRGKYDWKTLDVLIDHAGKLGMRLDIIWGGTNFCGQLDTRFAPDWLLDWDAVQLKDEKGNIVRSESGDFGMGPVIDHSNQEILNVEKEMLRKLIGHLKEYDKKHRVVFFQVLNEPNLHNWTKQDMKQVLNYANGLASVFKEADYKIATRMNMSGNLLEPAIEALGNIDCQGADPYTEDIKTIRKIINTTTKMPYIAENAAYKNTSSMMVTSFANGGFYNIYMLGPCLVWEKPGIYGINWEPWEVTYGVYNLNTAMNNVGSLIATAAKPDMVDFNTEDNYPDPNYEKLKKLAGRNIGMKTWGWGDKRNGAVGMGLYKDGYFYLIADRITSFMFNEEPLNVSSGCLDESGQWVETFRKYWYTRQAGFEVTYHAGECLRVKLKDAR